MSYSPSEWRQPPIVQLSAVSFSQGWCSALLLRAHRNSETRSSSAGVVSPFLPEVKLFQSWIHSVWSAGEMSSCCGLDQSPNFKGMLWKGCLLVVESLTAAFVHYQKPKEKMLVLWNVWRIRSQENKVTDGSGQMIKTLLFICLGILKKEKGFSCLQKSQCSKTKQHSFLLLKNKVLFWKNAQKPIYISIVWHFIS